MVVLLLYWAIPVRTLRNVLLLVASYFFYGFVEPWFCILIAVSTLIDYGCGLAMEKFPGRKFWFVIISLVSNLGMLGFFKYFNFFYENVEVLLGAMGLHPGEQILKVALPVGISFYTFQTLSYTIDVYRGQLAARRNFIDFALYVALFPQLVAGPIERATRLLPQIEVKQRWNLALVQQGLELVVRGYIKKLLVADHVAIFANQVFMVEKPNLLLLLAGTCAFALQIYADFSAYTDIARGTAKFFGFDLIENFRSPYLAISPSDFWRRWHISLSTWIRDYVYIPLGGSRVKTSLHYLAVILTTMTLCGLWHGAAWTYFLWGLFHGLILWAYHALGLGGRWQPKTRALWLLAWSLMTVITLAGWVIFRAHSLGWLGRTLGSLTEGYNYDVVRVSVTILVYVAIFWIPFGMFGLFDRFLAKQSWLQGIGYGMLICLTVMLLRDSQQDFIYFRF
jgi:D-alanyl-lipoteichoic acid acyltransferase DltB (MBOAT superfamily)